MIVVHVRKKPDRRQLQLFYVCPLTGRDITKSARTDNIKEAERKAALWEQELAQRGIGNTDSPPSWEQFRLRLELEYLATLAKKTRLGIGTALNHWERIVGKPKRIDLISPTTISQFAVGLRELKGSPVSVQTHMRHVRAALRWAVDIGMIRSLPRFIMPKLPARRSLARSRPITREEFERMLKVTPKIRPKDYKLWRWYLEGLWLSGLRLGESTVVSWDSPPIYVDLDGRRPKLVFLAEGHKGRYDDTVPIAPDFSAFLEQVQKSDRVGRIFKLPYATTEKTGGVVSAIGAKANVKVNEKGKTASAHDIRRAFGTRWASKVMPVVLQRLMRHREISTTLKYYVDQGADEVGDQIWASLRNVNRTPDSTPKTENGSPRRK